MTKLLPLDTTSAAPLDVLSCEREALQTPGAVQSAATLLLFRPDSGCLAVASDNLQELFGETAALMTGCGLERFFCSSDAAALAKTLARQQEPVSRVYRLFNDTRIWGHVFRSGGLLGIEVTPCSASENSANLTILEFASLMDEIGLLIETMLDEASQDIASLGQIVVERIRTLSGFDRAMLYRFDNDWNGEVIAEAYAKDLAERFRNHHFPSSDIPKQARDMFLRNRVRTISDAQASPVALSMALNPLTGQLIDLSDCALRAVSPVHLEYLANMGVRASMSIALVTGGKLWGLVTCHHYRGPMMIDPSTRAACRIFCESVSGLLSRLLDRRKVEAAERARVVASGLRDAVIASGLVSSTESFLSCHSDELLELLGCDGIAFFSEDRLVLLGHTPPEALVRTLRTLVTQRLDTHGVDCFVTHHAVGYWPELLSDLRERGAGLVAVREEGGISVLFAFRAGRPEVIDWGGNPYKQVESADSDMRLRPRGSFKLWREHTQDRSLPWSPEAVTLVRAVKSTLAEVDWIIQQRLAEDKLAQAKLAAEASETDMRHRALHDALTGLPNRRYLAEQVDQLIAEGVSSDREVALMQIDLDRFKDINDSFGHATGDKLLCHVADILRETIRHSDIAARIGGDEFVVVCKTGTELANLTRMAQRIIDDLSRPLKIDGNICRFGASIGIACGKLDGLSYDRLMARADIALYDAKRSGRGRLSIFTQTMEVQFSTATKLREEIERAIEAGEFRAFYQPQFDARTLDVVGLEALARWYHPRRGILEPTAFVGIADELGLTGAIDGAILDCAVQDRERWIEAGHAVPTISVNVSVQRLRGEALVDLVRGMKIPPGSFAFELLETIDLDEPGVIEAWNIEGLRNLGIEIEIDDFGSGRTSIVSLVRLMPDRLKIDRQLIAPIVHSDAALNLVASIVEIGRTLGIGITAEGVETMAHAEKLRTIGCGALQGFAFSKPLPVEDVMAFLSSQSWRST